MRHLILILGDQLDAHSAAFDGFDPKQDALWMAEVSHESTKVLSHKARSTLFLSAMRHFAAELQQRGWPLHYHALQVSSPAQTLGAQLQADIARLQPQKLIMVQAGEWSVDQELQAVARAAELPLERREDRHFLASTEDFAQHAKGRKMLRLEYFYREMRLRYGILLEKGKPVGGQWNFDAENRGSFGQDGPPLRLPPRRFEPDAITREVIAVVNARFANHPGDLTLFDWPVTRAEALEALEDFIAHRLAQFGEYQDAMWSGEPWLFHSRLSAALNLKLLRPLEVIERAQQAWQQGQAPLAAVEGFIRQILGWREFVRGIYWHFMPGYIEKNALEASRELPGFYWNGKTDMACLRDAIGQTLRLGYAHHIQRLMVTGLYALLAGVRPRAVHEWYLAMYVDAVEWVELPNTLGMSQHGDGGIMASKPYIASGKYLQRMGNFCEGCRYDPGQWQGPRACPFSLLYRDFLRRHRSRFEKHPRLRMQVRHLDGLSEAQLKQLELDAEALLQSQL
jgi:deoxyribodipyrimidine photolyase-related protein